MGKRLRCVLLCLILAGGYWIGALLADRHILNEETIRIHVVANSDSQQDQMIKLQVRDAILNSLQTEMRNASDADAAKTWIGNNLTVIQDVANDTLQQMGCDYEAIVTLCREAFDTRKYETFTLPAGIYHALRITIGEGAGENWWCVAFPDLCIPATTDGFEVAAAGAGFPDSLTDALAEETVCELRFFLLDTMGRIENIFFRS